MNPTTSAVPAASLTRDQVYSAVGALIGAAVGDALGARFEFREAGLYSRVFPAPVLGGIGEMIGGGAFQWRPGEFTDDTQMALALAEALLAEGGDFDPARVWEHFQAWSKDAADIGNTTRASLSLSDHRTASKQAHDRFGVSGGNGSVMRIAPIGIAGVRWGADKTRAVAYGQSLLTHYDPVAGLSAFVAAELIRQLILGATIEGALASIAAQVDDDSRETFEAFFVLPWHPQDWTKTGNGYSIVCLAQAVWAVRSTSSFEAAVTAAVDLGDDADTVAAVTGAIAGALHGIQNIPARWVTYLNGSVTQPGGVSKTYHQHDLVAIAHRLLGMGLKEMSAHEPILEPRRVHSVGVYAANATGAMSASTDMGIISLCRMEDALHGHPYRREFHIVDRWGDGHNPHLGAVLDDAVASIEAFLEEGREVVVHCHGGRSRTGFVLKAWYMRRFNVDHATAEQWLQGQWEHYASWNDDFMAHLDAMSTLPARVPARPIVSDESHKWQQLIDEIAEYSNGSAPDELGVGHVNALLGSVRLIQSFPWPTWGAPMPTIEEIANLSLADCVRHITRISRADRTMEGTIWGSIQSGHLLALCQAAHRLAGNGMVPPLAELEPDN